MISRKRLDSGQCLLKYLGQGGQIEQWRPTLIALKQKFAVKQGHEGKRFVVDGHGIFWNEYCQLPVPKFHVEHRGRHSEG